MFGQAVLIAGLSALLTYNIYYDLWPVICPIVFEMSCISYLIILKTYIGKVQPNQSVSTTAKNEEDLPFLCEKGLSDPTTNQKRSPPDASSVE